MHKFDGKRKRRVKYTLFPKNLRRATSIRVVTRVVPWQDAGRTGAQPFWITHQNLLRNLDSAQKKRWVGGVNCIHVKLQCAFGALWQAFSRVLGFAQPRLLSNRERCLLWLIFARDASIFRWIQDLHWYFWDGIGRYASVELKRVIQVRYSFEDNESILFLGWDWTLRKSQMNWNEEVKLDNPFKK